MKKEVILPILFSWVFMIATDFFIHGGILAKFYMEESPFTLDPLTAFQRIPLGYFSFLLMAILLYWFFQLEENITPRKGFINGIKLGGLIWMSFALGLYSISTANLTLLIGWLIGQTIEMGIGGYVLAMLIKNPNYKKTFIYLVIYFVIIIIITVTMQNSGLAPSLK